MTNTAVTNSTTHETAAHPRKTTILQFRVTAEERALTEAAARQAGVSTSEFLRAEARRRIGAPQALAAERKRRVALMEHAP